MKNVLQKIVIRLGFAALSGATYRECQIKTASLDDFIAPSTGVNTSATFVWNSAYDAEWMHSPLIAFYQKHVGQPTPLHQYRDLYDELHNEGFSAQSFSDVFTLDQFDFQRVHAPQYIAETVAYGADPLRLNILTRGDTPRIHETVELQSAFVNGTYTAGVLALQNGIAMNLGGGLHHAMSNHGEGFCIFNDTAIAIRKLQEEERIKTALIIDTDVHHGNGNAQVFHYDSSVQIIDVYQEDSYPVHKIPVTFPITYSLEDVITDEVYLAIIPEIVQYAQQKQPDIIFYLAGADPYKEDRLGGFFLTKEGLQKRDELIIYGIREANIPLVVLPAGGYSSKQEDVVDIHYNTAIIVAESQKLF